ncbi:hypothetical protein [Mycolicibacterium mageritense]|uniref:hypothetical protein n=1 Tax=Mycolicibacterium mageritense TaxID=53462 RepID=UPI001E4A57A9|nr:hypothetical protein [Mycolicibacterium mageritense]GJJ23702.1 hypothetical protein MTY414_73750 [Mycolicibacterium mageritense]
MTTTGGPYGRYPGTKRPGRSRTRMAIHTPADRKDPQIHRPSWDAVRSIIARHDTLRAEAIHEARVKANKAAEETIAERVEHSVQYRMRDMPDADALTDRLKRVEEALGASIDWSADDRQGLPFHGQVSLGQIAEIAAAVRAHGSIEKAAAWFTQGWNDPVGNTRDALRRLESALNEMRKAGGAV